MANSRAVTSVLLLILAAELAWLALPAHSAADTELSYNILISSQIDEEKLDRMVSELEKMNVSTVKLWLSTRILDDFSYWDLAIGKFSRAGIDVALDPWFRMEEMDVPGGTEKTNVLWKGERIPDCPSIFAPETRDFMLEVCSRMGEHYSKERPDLGAGITSITVLNEPFVFLSCAKASPELPLKWLIDEDFDRAPRHLRAQNQELSELFLECKELIKENLDVPVLLETTPPPLQPLELDAWKHSDISAVHIYPGNYYPFDWFIYKCLIEQARGHGKPIWVTEWSFDALCLYKEIEQPTPEFIQEFMRLSQEWGVEKAFFFSLLFPTEEDCYPLYSPESGWLTERLPVKEALEEFHA
ncbi:MAG: glycosyl hydrolase [Candidatus Aenigmatarchaeota archaeon]